MRSGNPFLGDKSFDLVERGEARMTLMGTVNKTAILLALTLISALWVWNKYYELQDPASIMPLMWIGIIGGLVLALITTFAKKAALYCTGLCPARGAGARRHISLL